MNVPMMTPKQRWVCPNCDLEEVTHLAKPHTRMHTCPGAKYMTVPMVHAGTDAKVELTKREDYLGEDDGHAQVDEDGTPWMNAITTHADGSQDCAVFAPSASATARS